MNAIVKATKEDSELLARIGSQTLLESHGHSAPKPDMDAYVEKNYSAEFFLRELDDPANIYHVFYHDDKPAGYSKIILDYEHPNIQLSNATKLERIYLLKEFYEMRLGQELLDLNIGISKSAGQSGMWLFVWKENERATRFYQKNGFTIVGSHDFRISETHSNPNHQMLLEY